MAAKKRNGGQRKRSRDDQGGGGSKAGNDKGVEGLKQQSKSNGNSGRMFSFSSRQMAMTAGVLGLAIGMGVLWNWTDPVDARVKVFLSRACSRKGGAKCMHSIAPTRRTFQTSRDVRKGETLLEIPRSMQIWDLDALRDDFIRKELFPARHARTDNRLPSGAYLAAFVAMQAKTLTLKSNVATKEYLQMLPTYDELVDHPILWEEDELSDALSVHSSAFNVVKMYRDMVTSEYDAFATASTNFATLITKAQYQAARINVLSRSFGPGPNSVIGPWQPETSTFETWDDELSFYEQELGLDFSRGCHVLVPMLDMLNHHPNPNVGYKFDHDSGAFIIQSERRIPSNWELMDSYGKYSDAHLFAKFGFNNGDGSGRIQAGISIHHRLLGQGKNSEFSYLPNGELSEYAREVQSRDLVRYLIYDDGYDECIEGPQTHMEDFSLKLLKLEHLLMIANDESRWSVIFPPRAARSGPAETSAEPITLQPPELDPRLLRVNYSKLVSTCRLMVLTTRDFDGSAIEVLGENRKNTSFVLEPGDQALEYRAVMCLARLASTTLIQFQPALEKQERMLRELNANHFQNRNWTAAHVRYGEMQGLQALAGIAFATVKQWDKEFVDKSDENFKVRESSCPLEYSQKLLNPGDYLSDDMREMMMGEDDGM